MYQHQDNPRDAYIAAAIGAVLAAGFGLLLHYLGWEMFWLYAMAAMCYVLPVAVVALIAVAVWALSRKRGMRL